MTGNADPSAPHLHFAIFKLGPEKHWWQGTDKSGRKRDVTQTTLEPPLGSGPHRLREFQPGRSLAYEKVADYWGKDLAVIIGTRVVIIRGR